MFSFKLEPFITWVSFFRLQLHPIYLHFFSEQVCIFLPFPLISPSPKNSCFPNLSKSIRPRIRKQGVADAQRNNYLAANEYFHSLFGNGSKSLKSQATGYKHSQQ